MFKATLTAFTDYNGNAYASYRLPNIDSYLMPFNNYTITAFVNVAQTRVSDSYTFQFNYLLKFIAMTPPEDSTFGQTTHMTVLLKDNSFLNQNYVLTWAVADSKSILIGKKRIRIQV